MKRVRPFGHDKVRVRLEGGLVAVNLVERSLTGCLLKIKEDTYSIVEDMGST